MDEETRKRRLLVIGVESKKWIEHMILMFAGKKVEIKPETAFEIFMQGAAMCAFGEYVLEPSEDRLLYLNNVMMAIGVEFRF